MHFARQDSKSQGFFMRPTSVQQVLNFQYITLMLWVKRCTYKNSAVKWKYFKTERQFISWKVKRFNCKHYNVSLYFQDDQSSVPFTSTRSHQEWSSELAAPMFSQPASINSNFPKVRKIQYVVDDVKLPSSQPPKFSRTAIKRDAPVKFMPKNNTYATEHLGNWICHMTWALTN